MVLYVEACYAGSMFADLLPNNINSEPPVSPSSTVHATDSASKYDRNKLTATTSSTPYILYVICHSSKTIAVALPDATGSVKFKMAPGGQIIVLTYLYSLKDDTAGESSRETPGPIEKGMMVDDMNVY